MEISNFTTLCGVDGTINVRALQGQACAKADKTVENNDGMQITSLLHI